MNAKTDTTKIKKDDPANPEVCMVYYYHKLIQNDNLETVCKECKNGSRGCVACKKELIAKMNEFLTPIREKRAYYLEHTEEVQKILENGSMVAKKKAESTLSNVKTKMNINYEEL